MKYQLGDEIIVLQTQEEGKIIEIINDKMVMIEIRGVKFPAYMDQIDFPYFYRFSKKKVVTEEKKTAKIFIDNIPKEKPQPNKINTPDGVWLVFIPKFSFDEFDDEYVETLKIHLVNKTNFGYKFTYENDLAGRTNFSIQNEILPYHDFYIHDLAFEFVNDTPSFNFDFSLSKQNKLKNDNYETSLKLKPKQIFNAIEKLKTNNEPTFRYKLFDEYPDRIFEPTISLDKLTNKGFKVYEASKYKDHLPQARTVVDLHIEKLVADFSRMSNAEILEIQLKEFDKWYNLAVLNRFDKFTVIHGIGKGKLKEEIHHILNTKKEVKSFINQFTDAFGFGATEIFFRH